MTQTYVMKETDVQAFASAESFARGQHYFHDGAVLEVTRRGNLITAEVEGSDYEPYRVQVTLAPSGITDTICTCPYDWGGICKHIVATLLTAIHQPETITEKPPIATLLADLTAEQLRQILRAVAEMGPEFADAVEQEAAWLRDRPITPAAATATTNTTVDVAAVRREMRKDFRLAGKGDPLEHGYYDEYAAMEVDPDEILRPHLEKIQELLDGGDVATAVSLITTIIDAYIDGLTELDEWVYEYNQDALYEAELTLGAVLAEVLLSLELTPKEQKKWLDKIEEWAEGLSDLEIAETAVQHGWTYPPLVAAMQGHLTDMGAWADEVPDYFEELAQARLRILARQGRTQEYLHLAEAEGQVTLYVNMMAQSGDVGQAVVEAQGYLLYPTDVLIVAHILVARGEIEAALTVAEHGLSLEQASGKVELARWLREQATAIGKQPLALKAAQVAFAGSYDLADYTAVQQLAGSAWQTIQPQLLQALAKSGSATRQVAIYLHEKMLVQAMQALDRDGFWLEDDLRRVIQATREQYSDWGIQKCQRKAEAIMDAGKAGAYETAVAWLGDARTIYQQHNRLPEWQRYLDGILKIHQRKYKLVPMLRNIR